jgi:hypothetical protein
MGMGVAVVTAISVIVAALVGIVVSLVTANETSARLLREAETLSKLEPGSYAYKLMEDQMVTSIIRYKLDSDAKWENSLQTVLRLVQAVSFVAAFGWMFIGVNADIHKWVVLYYCILFLLMAGVVLPTLLFWVDNILRKRKSRKANQPSTTDSAPDAATEPSPDA